jgi:hypothetical protein
VQPTLSYQPTYQPDVWAIQNKVHLSAPMTEFQYLSGFYSHRCRLLHTPRLYRLSGECSSLFSCLFLYFLLSLLFSGISQSTTTLAILSPALAFSIFRAPITGTLGQIVLGALPSPTRSRLTWVLGMMSLTIPRRRLETTRKMQASTSPVSIPP